VDSGDLPPANATLVIMPDTYLGIFYLLCTWSNLVKLLFLIFFALTILTFPWGEDIKQWAARKPLLRKVFRLNDLPLEASKNIKNLCYNHLINTFFK
jgi:hypothetical protein